MSLSELEQRMAGWLSGEYQAAVFEVRSEIVGYALFCREPQFVYLRQLFVIPSLRRRGIGRKALAWLWEMVWADAPRLRIDVLVNNKSGEAFWRSLGFKNYCLTMELESPMPINSGIK
jgi:GNAT superfamily N-acetyltransferase